MKDSWLDPNGKIIEVGELQHNKYASDLLEEEMGFRSVLQLHDFNIPRLSAVIYSLKKRYSMNIVAERKTVAGKNLVAYVLRKISEIKKPESVIGKVFDTGTKKYGKVVAVRAVGCDGCVFRGMSRCNKPQDIPICYMTQELLNYQKKSE